MSLILFLALIGSADCELQGNWVGPELKMTIDEDCNGIFGSTKFVANSEEFKRGGDTCKVFYKANELTLECGKEEAERYHRFSETVHK